MAGWVDGMVWYGLCFFFFFGVGFPLFVCLFVWVVVGGGGEVNATGV